MSVLDIIDYVNRTPYNTNPAVIRSMVENEIRQNGAECCEDLKQIKSEGGVGYTETWSITWDGNLDGRFTIKLPMPEASFVLVHVSDRALTADEVIGSVLTTKNVETGEESSHVIIAEDVQETVFGGVSADSANIVSVSQDTDSEGIHLKAGTYFLAFSAEEYSYYVTSIVVKSVHPIKPKYLSSIVIDLDELGLTNPILKLFNDGGGVERIERNNTYGIDIQKVCKVFPLDKQYVVKLTVPDMGTMIVNPVYTMAIDGKFRTAHLDCYIDLSSGFKKFHVRIIGSYRDGGEADYVIVQVGFYE